jgi:intracellular sulfur oxidation DsrE/DsrF family protein
MALNNAENLVKFYKDRDEEIEIEFVAYGAGLSMMRSDTSPVKERLAAISRTLKNITFTGCGNTLANQSKQEDKDITLVPEARLVPAGIARITELEEQGWTYVRP